MRGGIQHFVYATLNMFHSGVSQECPRSLRRHAQQVVQPQVRLLVSQAKLIIPSCWLQLRACLSRRLPVVSKGSSHCCFQISIQLPPACYQRMLTSISELILHRDYPSNG